MLRSLRFWLPATATAVLAGLFFAWELDLLEPYVMGPPRPAVTQTEIILTFLILFFMSVNVGMFTYLKRYGSCPVGTRRTTSFAAVLGAGALLCPVCVFGSFTFIGFTFAVSFLTPFIPLLQVIAVIVLGTTFMLLLGSIRKK